MDNLTLALARKLKLGGLLPLLAHRMIHAKSGRPAFQEACLFAAKGGKIKVKKALFVTFIGMGFGFLGGFGFRANLAWGSQIALVSDEFKPGREIIIINSDGTVPQQLKSPAGPIWPTWSPDGKKIAFVAASPPSWIYMMDADGRHLTRIIRSPSFSRPTWSADGEKIAFTSVQVLTVFDLKTKEETPLFFHPMDNGLGAPAWSPGGSRIAFTIKHERQHEIHVIDADGTRLRQLTKHPADDHAPAWSPDGRQIAFFSNRDRKPGICLMDADGANFKRITDGGENDPSWSPTGTHIAFSVQLIHNIKIGVMKANGTDLEILFEGNHPSWRPDGSAALDPVGKLSLTWGQVKLGL